MKKLCTWVKGRGDKRLFLAIGANPNDLTLLLHDGRQVKAADVTEPDGVNSAWQELLNDIPAMIAYLDTGVKVEMSFKDKHVVSIRGEEQPPIMVFEDNPALALLMSVQSDMNRARFFGCSDSDDAVMAMNLAEEAAIKGFYYKASVKQENDGGYIAFAETNVLQHKNPVICLIGVLTEPKFFI